MLLTQFVLERLLHRLAGSAHAGEFLLKGAMLFAAWTGGRHRATRDLDLSGRGTSEVPHLVHVFREVASLVVEPDGVVFDPSSIQAERIREDQVYEGVRVTMVARLFTARVGVQVDVGFGDAVHRLPRKSSIRRCSGCRHRACVPTHGRSSWPRSSRQWCRSAN